MIASKTIYQQFENELRLRGYSPQTIRGYVKCVFGLVWHYQRLPETITEEELREYIIQKAITESRPRSEIIRTTSALRAYFRYVQSCPDEWIETAIPTIVTPAKIATFTAWEIERLLNSDRLNLRRKVMLTTMYAAGLRGEEVCQLKITDIKSSWNLLRVGASKGVCERFVPISDTLLSILRNYWRMSRPSFWLFPDKKHPDRASQIWCPYRAYKQARIDCGIADRKELITLRHSYAIHSLELGISLPLVQKFLGHRWPISTFLYKHLMRNWRIPRKNPLELIQTQLKEVAYEEAA